MIIRVLSNKNANCSFVDSGSFFKTIEFTNDFTRKDLSYGDMQTSQRSRTLEKIVSGSDLGV